MGSTMFPSYQTPSSQLFPANQSSQASQLFPANQSSPTHLFVGNQITLSNFYSTNHNQSLNFPTNLSGSSNLFSANESVGKFSPVSSSVTFPSTSILFQTKEFGSSSGATESLVGPGARAPESRGEPAAYSLFSGSPWSSLLPGTRLGLL